MNKKALTLVTGSLAALALPLISSAQTITNINTLGQFIIATINNVIVPVLFAVAFIVFIYGVFETFILGAGNDEAKEKGKSLMLWGLIGFFVMVSVWGLVNILTGTFVFGNNNNVNTPSAGVQVGG
jgi:hypothetical protein